MVTQRRLDAHRDTPAVLINPQAFDVVVENDSAARTLVVRLGEHLTGTARAAWERGWNSAVFAQQDAASYVRTPELWGINTDGEQVAHGVPGDNGTLRFYFPPGNTAYKALVSKPGLYGVAVVDREQGHFLRIAFKHRR
jgi:hypothetical protein